MEASDKFSKKVCYCEERDKIILKLAKGNVELSMDEIDYAIYSTERVDDSFGERCFICKQNVYDYLFTALYDGGVYNHNWTTCKKCWDRLQELSETIYEPVKEPDCE